MPQIGRGLFGEFGVVLYCCTTTMLSVVSNVMKVKRCVLISSL